MGSAAGKASEGRVARGGLPDLEQRVFAKEHFNDQHHSHRLHRREDHTWLYIQGDSAGTNAADVLVDLVGVVAGGVTTGTPMADLIAVF